MAGNEDILRSIGQRTMEPAAHPQRVKPARGAEAARKFAMDSARLLHDHKCEEIVILDLRGISPICDFFVIANGTSDRQMRSVVDLLKQMGKAVGESPFGVSGYDESTWIIVDFVDVVIHLFDGEHRAFYDLDSLWGDGGRVEWSA